MLVIFDCDGVLVDSEPIVNRVEAEFLSSSGWTLSPQESRELFKGHTFAEIIGIVDQRLPGVVSDHWVYKLAMATAQAFHRDLEPAPGVKDLLLALKQRDVPVCVASQSVLPRVMLSLQICELDPFFGSKVYTASMVARPKPAPDLFLHAAASCGVVPEACTVIEDSPSGVRAAVAAGMKVLGYSAAEDADVLKNAGAVTFTRMSEVLSLLEIA